MANIASADEIIRTSFLRTFIQPGGPRPSNPLRYGGADGAYIEVGDDTIPVRGGITREQVHDPFQIGAYKTVGVIEAPPDFATGQVMFRNLRGRLPWLEIGAQCRFNLYQPAGFCRNPSDFSAGWETGVKIFSQGLATNRSGQGNAKFSEDVASVTMADTTWTGGVYWVGTLSFGEEAASTITREIIGVTYATAYECGRCSAPNDGTIWRYALQQDDGASTGIRASVIYTVDDGATFTTSTITSLGGNDAVTAIAVMGGYLIVLSSTGNAYHYATIDDQTGTVGSWTAVTTGFVASNTPNDIWVQSPNFALIAGENGYVYQLTTVGQGVKPVLSGSLTTEDLRRIDGSSDVVVATGTNGTIVVSTNRGSTWAAAGSLGVADTVQAVSVVDAYLWWVGTNAGNLYYTQNGGETWTSYAFSGSGSGNVYDIVHATPEVMYVSHSTSGPDARILASISGGALFDLSTGANQRRLSGLPTFDIARRLAVPTVGPLASRAGHLLIGGLAGNGTDGILLHGVSNFDFTG